MTKSGRAKKASVSKSRSQKVSVDTGHAPGSKTVTSAPTWEELAVTVLIVAEDEAQAVTKELGVETNFRVFADTDAIKALQRITRDRPQLEVLGRAFVDTPRGAALVNTIKTDHTLANTQIRVISRAGDYVRLVRRTGPKAASDTAMPGEPLPSNYLGTRVARRYKLRPGLEMRVDGNPTTLVELSGTGAQVVASAALGLNRRVRLVMGKAPDIIRCSGVVVWVSFELRGESAPRYRAGVQFKDVDLEAVEAFILRHRQR